MLSKDEIRKRADELLGEIWQVARAGEGRTGNRAEAALAAMMSDEIDIRDRALEMDWAKACMAWQEWAGALLKDLGRQPIGGLLGDHQAREALEKLVMMAPGVPRCSRCGCFVTRHEVDNEERRECVDCECAQFER